MKISDMWLMTLIVVCFCLMLALTIISAYYQLHKLLLIVVGLAFVAFYLIWKCLMWTPPK